MSYSREEMLQKNVAVLMGGESAEREVSFQSGRAALSALKRKQYQVVDIDVGPDVAADLRRHGVEVAFIALHGKWGEDGCLQGLLETMNIPYTGSKVLSSALAMDKDYCSRVLMAENIPVPPYKRVDAADARLLKVEDLDFSLPVVIKPNTEGSSVGVSIVRNPDELQPAIEKAAEGKHALLIQEFHPGKEINVAILGDRVLGAIEIVPKGEFYDYEAKYLTNDTHYLYPPSIQPKDYKECCDLALKVHKALGCSGVTRTDLIFHKTRGTVVLEINTMPGLTSHSLVPKIAQGVGIGFDDLMEEMLLDASLGLARTNSDA